MARPSATRRPLAVLHAVLAATVTAALPSCGDPPADPADDAACARLLSEGSPVDAAEYFRTPSAVPKRLGRLTNEESLALALAFEERGAARVLAITAAAPGDAPADGGTAGLVITLPEEPPRRLAVFRLYANAIRDAGFAPRADRGQRYLFLPATPRG